MDFLRRLCINSFRTKLGSTRQCHTLTYTKRSVSQWRVFIVGREKINEYVGNLSLSCFRISVNQSVKYQIAEFVTKLRLSLRNDFTFETIEDCCFI